MSRIISDQERKQSIIWCYELIESAIQTARSHMTGGPGCRPEVVDQMFEVIGWQVQRAGNYKWPDPAARLAQAAANDETLQKLIKRVHQKTPIRAK